MKQVLLANLHATETFGELLAQSIEEHAYIALSGQMGAGKTTLIKALAKSLGITQIVNSPTFILMNEYQGGRLPLYHLDLYRFGETDLEAGTGASANYDLSFLALEVEELYGVGGIVAVEWPEYFVLDELGTKTNFFSLRDHLKINLAYAQDDAQSRTATLEAEGTYSSSLAKKLFNLGKDVFSY